MIIFFYENRLSRVCNSDKEVHVIDKLGFIHGDKILDRFGDIHWHIIAFSSFSQDFFKVCVRYITENKQKGADKYFNSCFLIF